MDRSLASIIVVGAAILSIVAITTVGAAPSGYNNPIVFGHNPADIEPGIFSGNLASLWFFPGIVSVGNFIRIGTAPLPVVWDIRNTGGSFEIMGNTHSNPSLIVSSDGKVGIGLGASMPSEALDVGGNVHATGDVCSDAAGGRCLSDTQGAIKSGWSTTCSPNIPSGCENNFNENGTFVPINLQTVTQPMVATCPAGTVIVECTGGIRAYGLNAASKGHVIYHLGNGCAMEFAESGADEVGGYVRAYCAPITP